MKQVTFIILSLLFVLNSCSSYKSSGAGVGILNPKPNINVSNNWELVPGESPITYTIDISTPEGRQKLNKLTLEEVKTLAVNEAAQAHGAITIVQPVFTQLQKGKREILRITVSGIPAYYKNAGYFNKQTEHPGGNSNINVKINQSK